MKGKSLMSKINKTVLVMKSKTMTEKGSDRQMRKEKEMEYEIKKCGNFFGGLWFRIKVDKDLTTEVAFFIGIKELQVFEFLKNPFPKEEINSALEIELFASEQSKY